MSMWQIGGALLGGLLGGQSSTQSNTQSRDPYAPAKPYIDQTINNGMALQNKYAAQPLSLGQIEAYANAQGLSDGFRSQAGSLTNQMNGMRQFDRGNPTQRASQFNFTDAPLDQQKSMQSFVNALPQTTQVDLGRRIVEGGLLAPQSSGGGRDTLPSAGTWQGGIGSGMLKDSINANAMDTFKTYAPFSAMGAGLAALYQRHQEEQAALAKANAAQDPIAHLNSVQGWTGRDGGGAGSYFGGGYDGSGFSGVGSSGYGHSGYGSSEVKDSDIQSN